MSENLRYQMEYQIQQLIKEKQIKSKSFSQNELLIMAGKGGTHSCFLRNLERVIEENITVSQNLDVKVNLDQIISCKKICRVKSVLMATSFFLLLCGGLTLKSAKHKKPLPNVFIWGIPNERLNFKNLITFFSEKRFSDLLDVTKDDILIQSKRLRLFANNQKIDSTLYIPLYIFRRCLGLKQQLFILRQILLKIKPLIQNKTDHEYMLCFRELIFDQEIWKLVTSDTELKMFCTQSNLRLMPFPMYKSEDKVRTQNYMLWYSANSSLVYKKNEKKIRVESNYLALSHIDMHLVWNALEKFKLEKYVMGRVRNIGSIVFQPQIFSAKESADKFNGIIVTYFDITPKKISNESNFVSMQIAIDSYHDIKDVLQSVSHKLKLNIQFVVKPKRPPRWYFSHRYSRALKIDSVTQQIKLAYSRGNLYELIADSDLVIGFPWTSPLFIARELSTPAIYYRSDVCHEWDVVNPLVDIPLFTDKKSLEAEVCKILSKLLPQ